MESIEPENLLSFWEKLSGQKCNRNDSTIEMQQKWFHNRNTTEMITQQKQLHDRNTMKMIPQ